jgi:hypothetical protein
VPLTGQVFAGNLPQPKDGRLLVTRQAWRIAARLRPEGTDLRVTAVACSGENEGGRDPVRRVPASGYVGPYPLREREEGGEDE